MDAILSPTPRALTFPHHAFDLPTPRAFQFPISCLSPPEPSPSSSSPSPFEPDRDLDLSLNVPAITRRSSPAAQIASFNAPASAPDGPISFAHGTNATTTTHTSTISLHGPERRPKRGDEDYIKRPENAFILFRRECCLRKNAEEAALAAANGNDGETLTTRRQRQADLSKTISQQWRSLSSEERKYWDNLAKQRKKEHEEMYPWYVYQPTRHKEKKVDDSGKVKSESRKHRREASTSRVRRAASSTTSSCSSRTSCSSRSRTSSSSATSMADLDEFPPIKIPTIPALPPAASPSACSRRNSIASSTSSEDAPQFSGLFDFGFGSVDAQGVGSSGSNNSLFGYDQQPQQQQQPFSLGGVPGGRTRALSEISIPTLSISTSAPCSSVQGPLSAPEGAAEGDFGLPEWAMPALYAPQAGEQQQLQQGQQQVVNMQEQGQNYDFALNLGLGMGIGGGMGMGGGMLGMPSIPLSFGDIPPAGPCAPPPPPPPSSDAVLGGLMDFNGWGFGAFQFQFGDLFDSSQL